MKLHESFISSLKQVLPEGEVAEFLGALKGEREFGFRVNTLKVPVKDLCLTSGQAPVPWCAQGFYYDKQKEAPLGKNPLYNAGLYYIQEPSAMSAAALLDAQSGDKVLDLCASPGGKSTQLASALSGEGLLVSNDASNGRIPQLLRNIEMAGVKNAIVMCETPERLAGRLNGFFDKVLVDAPCSGEGMFRKDPSAIAAWDETKPARLAQIQRGILHDAAKMVAGGGYMVYSTCTFNRRENEDVIDDFLAKNADFELVGQPLRIFPHTHRGEGHFAAKLYRKSGHKPSITATAFNHAQSALFEDFCKAHSLKLASDGIFIHGDRLFVAPKIYPCLAGLRIIRVGLFLGTLKKQRFEPSFALAMALKKQDFAQTIDLNSKDPMVTKFLSGESFEMAGEGGYNLFCVEGHPIGFAKLLNGRLKGRIK